MASTGKLHLGLHRTGNPLAPIDWALHIRTNAKARWRLDTSAKAHGTLHPLFTGTGPAERLYRRLPAAHHGGLGTHQLEFGIADQDL